MASKNDLAVERFGEIFELKAGELLRPGDRIVNKGNDVATVGAVSKSAEHPSLVATLKPGQSVRVTDAGAPEAEVLGLEADETAATITETPSDIAAAADFRVDPEVEFFEEETQGLFGAVPFLAGAGTLAAAAGAVGLAALASGSEDEGSGGTGEGGGAGGGTGVGTAQATGGLAGGLEQLNAGLEQTPLGPLTAVTGALADGLATAGEALGNAGDPTGLAATLGEILGGVNSGVGNAGEEGLVGLVNTVSTSLDNVVANGPLEPLAQLVDPLTQLLGSSAGQVDGVAEGLANVGSTLINDSSVLAPLTTDLLGPVVGTSTGQDGGLPQTLTQVGEGLTDLTNVDSALAPLNALTEPLSDAVLTQLASGIQTVGDGLAQVSAQDPSGVSGLLADLLGGTTTASTDTALNPLDGLTGLLGGDALGGLGDLGGLGALGGLGDLGAALPLSADALPASGDLLGATDGLSGISSGAGLPGLDALTGLLPA